MPRKGIPQHEFLRFQAKPEQRTPDNSSCRLGKTIRALFTLACSPCLDARKNVFRLNAVVFLFSQQDSLRGYGDSTEMSAAITERLCNIQIQGEAADCL